VGLFDSLFGSRDREIAPATPVTTQVPTLTQEQQDLLNQIIGNVSGAAGGFGGRPAPFAGDLSAGASELENLAFGSAADLFTQGGQVQDFLSGALTPFSEEGTIDRFNRFQVPFAREQQAESSRQLLESLSGTGGFTSGATSRALARSGREFDLGLQSQLGQQLNFAEQLANQRQFGGLSALLGIQQQGLGAGGVQRGIVQSDLDRQLNEFIRQQGVDPLLGLLPTLLGTSAFENITQIPNTVTSPTAATQIGGILSGVGSFF
jgi:hypothetical protein